MLAAWIALLVTLGLLLSPALAAERVDFFNAQGRRTGYAIVDQETGRVDFFDVNSRRTGWGRITPSGQMELFRGDGRRHGEGILPRIERRTER